MDRAQIEQAILAVYQPRLANDPEGCVASFSEEATFRLAGTGEDGTTVPAAIGRSALLETIRALVSIWRWVSQDIDSVVIDGERAVVRYHLTAEHLPSGETVVTEIVDHLRFDDRLLVLEMVEYIDTAMVGRLAAQSVDTRRDG